MEYKDFLRSKKPDRVLAGFDPGDDISGKLFDWQAVIVRWAVRTGRSAIFADCGLGKTPMQLEWARLYRQHTGKPVMILAPLAVSAQTVREGEKFGIHVAACRERADWTDGINITNYERLAKFSDVDVGAVVLDESSILKSYDGKLRKEITEFARRAPYRLACTATPAPNDLIELSNHSEFLGYLTGKEIIAKYFIQDGNTTHAYRLRGHAITDFYKWLASWAVATRSPSDIGFDDERFTLPKLDMRRASIEPTHNPSATLFHLEASTLQERRQARRDSLTDRVAKAAEIVNAEPNEQWLVWCDLNAESDALRKAIPDAVEVRGSDTAEHKESSMLGFSSGEVRVLVTKPSIAGFGMNWQNCARVVFVGLSDSYEQFYQAIRRCWRFGQSRDVHCYVVTATTEGRVVANIERKERQAAEMFADLVTHMRPYEEIVMGSEKHDELDTRIQKSTGDGWTMYNGDSTLVLSDPNGIPDNSIGLSVFSPPFPGMYAYTDKSEDIGNCSSIDELLEHFGFMVPDLLRITMPGRSCCIHLTQEPVFKGKDGRVGLRDFRGRVIALMESHGWNYYGEVTIDKDPQVKASRTKDHSLLFKTLGTDSTHCRMALADYLLQFRKPGENTVPVPSGKHPRWNPDGGWITPDEWIEWAAPVWYRANDAYPGGIKETDVLNVREGREDKDERHLCPLQLGVIERAVKLWSAPGDTVFSPFAGIGSEGYVALGLDRNFIGVELKESYFRVALKNLSGRKLQTSLDL